MGQIWHTGLLMQRMNCNVGLNERQDVKAKSTGFGKETWVFPSIKSICLNFFLMYLFLKI